MSLISKAKDLLASKFSDPDEEQFKGIVLRTEHITGLVEVAYVKVADKVGTYSYPIDQAAEFVRDACIGNGSGFEQPKKLFPAKLFMHLHTYHSDIANEFVAEIYRSAYTLNCMESVKYVVQEQVALQSAFIKLVREGVKFSILVEALNEITAGLHQEGAPVNTVNFVHNISKSCINELRAKG